MKILSVCPSIEPCEEAGWVAFDYLLDSPMERKHIQSLRPLGSLTYMTSLKRPFYKVESAHYVIKGLEADDSMRVAVHRAHQDELKHIESVLSV